MKKTILFALIGVAFASNAIAGPIDFYIGATGSAGTLATYVPKGVPTGFSEKEIMKTSSSFGGAVGLDIPVIRVEAEYDYLISKNMSLSIGMVNGYIKLLPTPIVKPYFGFGIGRVFGGKIRGDIGGKPDASMPLQAMLGLQIGIPMTPLFVDVEGRVLYIESVYEMPIVNRGIGALQADLRAKIRVVF
jgi:hypothetical protein